MFTFFGFYDRIIQMKKILVGVGVPLLSITGAIFLYHVKIPIPCPLYRLFHIYCPGCGSGRAAVQILHLHFFKAFQFNPLFVIFLPFLLYYILHQYLSFVFGFKKLPLYHPGRKTTWAVALVIILFFILRNIPFFPFTLLAP